MSVLLETLDSQDKDRRYKAFTELLRLSDRPVSWAYEAWDRLLRLMKQGDNHQRAIGAQLLANLAKSDPEEKILKDINKLMTVTRDPPICAVFYCLLTRSVPL
ncbi:MAG TPA: hypothetical protein VHC46_07080 [Thermodesulfobacteriota bacterium]|nr:hypothetical protein [Thermodesulfobacteriota bacterium]